MPARGDTVLPSENTSTPDVPVPAHVLLTPADFGIPARKVYTPQQFATYFNKSARTIIREIEDGRLRAMRIRGEYVIPWREVCEYFMRQQGILN